MRVGNSGPGPRSSSSGVAVDRRPEGRKFASATSTWRPRSLWKRSSLSHGTKLYAGLSMPRDLVYRISHHLMMPAPRPTPTHLFHVWADALGTRSTSGLIRPTRVQSGRVQEWKGGTRGYMAPEVCSQRDLEGSFPGKPSSEKGKARKPRLEGHSYRCFELV